MESDLKSRILFLLLFFTVSFFSCRTEDELNEIEYKPVTVVTSTASSITTNSAIMGGVISAPQERKVTRGVCWSINPSPTVSLSTKTEDGTGIGTFSSTLTNLQPATNYYVRAYATSSASTEYGNVYSIKTASATSATLSTNAVTNVTTTTATCGGSITGDGGAAITARGVCWNTTLNPTIANSKTSDGTGTGSFASSITGLIAGTIYYVRAYATNSAGTTYGTQVSFTTTTSVGLPILTTTTISSITSSSAASGGNITSDGGLTVTARGICWSTTTNPTTALSTKTSDGTGTGIFTSSISGLTATTTYYVKSYATNSAGTAYGNEVSFTTTTVAVALPTLSTTTVTSILTYIAVGGGNITNDGGATVTAKGVCWSTTANPTTANNKTSDGIGTGTFTSSITGLIANTTYYVRAYATNSVGTAYGTQVSFITITLPTLSTSTVSSILSTTATCGGNVTSDGGSTVTAKGVCWSTSANPTTANNKTSDGIGTGTFTSSITGLTSSMTYYVRAYATNSAGTAYGTQVSFMTAIVISLPTISTAAVSSITAITATGGGNITNDGGEPISAKGVCWSMLTNPTVTTGGKTSDGYGIGVFTSSITGLSSSVTYYVRAYATNSAGTAYGTQVSFTTTTSVGLPILTTTTISSITSSSAASGGNITSDGGLTVTARGICWSTNSSPTTSLSTKTSEGTGTGIFTSSLSQLAANTTYYVRAYATNTAGTTYGNEVSFTTNSVAIALPTLGTAAVTSITATTASSGGMITNDGGATVTAKGVCWSNTANPTTLNSKTSDGIGTGTFSSSITGLTPNTTYFVRAYATNSAGTAYGTQVSFSSLNTATIPILSTTAVTSILTTSATSGGFITNDGSATVTARGVCWSTTSTPTTANSKTTDGTGIGIFSSSITGLTANTTYYVRAYATNSAGTAYGNEVSFTTSSITATVPTLTTTTVSSILANSATCAGNITNDGGATVTARGVCWSTSSTPTTNNNRTTDGTGTGIFTSSLSGLTANATYYIRAYATNSVGTAYGNELSFKTFAVMDNDGNGYHSVTIGTQTWLVENLKTTRYNDGTTISLVTDNTSWKTLVTPAFCWYNNDSGTYKNIYGALYNWYTVGSGKLAPTGWHVPTDADWTTLTNYLGGETVVGGKLKETGYIHWTTPNTGATNETGFLALPGGYRLTSGVFNVIGENSCWWSSTEISSTRAWGRFLYYNNANILGYYGTKSDGLSIRCVKD